MKIRATSKATLKYACIGNETSIASMMYLGGVSVVPYHGLKQNHTSYYIHVYIFRYIFNYIYI